MSTTTYVYQGLHLLYGVSDFHHDIRLSGPTSVIRCNWFPPRRTFIRVYICHTWYLISTTTYVYQGLPLLYGVSDFNHDTRLSGSTSVIRGIWFPPRHTFIRTYICYTGYLISTTTHVYQGLPLLYGVSDFNHDTRLSGSTSVIRGIWFPPRHTFIRTYICYTGYLISTTTHVYQGLHLLYGVYDFNHDTRLSGSTSVIRGIWFQPRHTFIRVYICYTGYLISTTTHVYQGLPLLYGVSDFNHDTRLSGSTSVIRCI